MSVGAVDAGARLPADVVALLSGDDLDRRVGFTMELLTVDADGWPRVALLSAGEVVAADDAHLRLALWPESRSTANLTRTGRGSLAFVHAGSAFTLRLEASRASDLRGPEPLAVFDGRVKEVRRDEAAYARLRSGITFELLDEQAVVARWRSTVERLRGPAA